MVDVKFRAYLSRTTLDRQLTVGYGIIERSIWGRMVWSVFGRQKELVN